MYAALDFETASGRTAGRICSVGVVCFDSDGIRDDYYTLCDPGCAMDPMCQRIHGLTEAMVESAPPISHMLGELAGVLDGCTVVAHCAAFDIKQLLAAIQREGSWFPAFDFYCSVVTARRAFPGRESYSLPRLKDIFGFDYDAHNALADAQACAALFARCADTVDWDIAQLGINPGRLDGDDYTSCKAARRPHAGRKRKGA